MSFEPNAARDFSGFAEAVRVAYEEEIVGETYFARLAEFHSGRARQALELMAAMEVVTAQAVEPVLQRGGIQTRSREALRSEGRAEAEALADQTATALFTTMRDTYDTYLREFERLVELADATDRPAMQILLDHEVAIIDFARAELAGEADSLRPLQTYLSRFSLPAPEGTVCCRRRRPWALAPPRWLRHSRPIIPARPSCQHISAQGPARSPRPCFCPAIPTVPAGRPKPFWKAPAW